MNEEIYTRGLRRGPEVPLTKRRFVFDFWLPFFITNKQILYLNEIWFEWRLGEEEKPIPGKQGLWRGAGVGSR